MAETVAEERGGQPARMELSEWGLVAALVVLAFLYFCYNLQFYPVISADGTSYALSGRTFFETWDPKSFGTVFPPLYPFLIGLFNLFCNNLELAARLVSVLSASLCLVPVYLLGRDFYGRTAAICSVILTMTLPLLHGMSGFDISEPLYTFCVFMAAILLWWAYAGGSPLLAAGAGAMLALAYLTRPEGFVLLVACSMYLLAMVVINRGRGAGRTLLLLMALWALFAVLAFPYLMLLREQTGHWQLSGKTAINSNVIKEYRGEAVQDSRFQLDKKGDYVKQEGSLTALWAQNPALFWSNILENLKAFPIVFNEAMPLFLWPLVLVGLFCGPWRGEALAGRLFLVTLLLPILLFVLFYIVTRYLYPYLPVFLILAGAGIARCEEWVRRSGQGRVGRFSPAIVAVSLAAAYFVYLERPQPKPPYHYEQDGGRYDDKRVGLRLRDIIPGKEPLMTRSGRVAFYAGRPPLIPPQAGFDEIITFARKNKATYLVANMQLLSSRPQLEMLFTPILAPGTPFTPPAGLKLVYQGLEQPGGLPYLVYRIEAQ